MRKIRVLVVEDSMVFRELLVRNLNADPGIEVIAQARDPYEARDRIMEERPDVMTLDIEMPRMNGIEFLQKLMPQCPIPVVMISALSDKVFDAMKAGAVDFVCKPSGSKEQIEQFIRRELPAKIKIASIAKLAAKAKKKTDRLELDTSVKSRGPAAPVGDTDIKMIAIGASTGGTEAIANVLKNFGPDVPGIVIVQHMPPGFTELYAARLNRDCQIAVKEAKNGDVVRPGQALLAPGGDRQMEVVKRGSEYQVVLKESERVNGHCPSVDVLFHSVAKNVGSTALGIILTGMGGDGARGLLAMRKTGSRTIGQNEATCVVYGMPKVAYELGGVEYQLKLGDIADKTYQLLRKNR